MSTRLYLEPRSTESERGHLTSLWKKGAGENLYVHALPSFLSFSPDPLRRRRRLIIVARQELKLFSWPVTSATPPPSSPPASSPSSSSAHWVAIFQLSVLTHFASSCRRLSSLVSKGGKAFRRRHSYSSPLPSYPSAYAVPLSTSPAWSVFGPEFHAGGDKSV